MTCAAAVLERKNEADNCRELVRPRGSNSRSATWHLRGQPETPSALLIALCG